MFVQVDRRWCAQILNHTMSLVHYYADTTVLSSVHYHDYDIIQKEYISTIIIMPQYSMNTRLGHPFFVYGWNILAVSPVSVHATYIHKTFL